MIRISILILFSVITFSLSACNTGNNEFYSDKAQERSIIDRGYNLKELGLEINIEKLREFDDINHSYKPTFYTYHIYEDMIFSTLDGNLSEYGNMSIFVTNFSDNRLDINYMPMLYLQGYEKLQDSKLELLIKLGNVTYEQSELENLKIYEDKYYIVYDFTEKFLVHDFERKIEIMYEWADDPQYNYDWLKDVYDYLKTYEDVEIKLIEENRE